MTSHSVERVLPYTAGRLFDIAADVERYPEFMPGWVAVRVRDRDARSYRTDQVVGFGPLRARFESRTTLHRPYRIDIVSRQRLFRRFELTWRFDACDGDRCRVRLEADLEFRTRTARAAFELFLSRSLDGIVEAFAYRAKSLYGEAKPSGPSGNATCVNPD